MQEETFELPPKDQEDKPFLVLAPIPHGDGLVWQQVTWFEGNLYPDSLGYNIDRGDVIDVKQIQRWVELPN
jgi:hypothetical protein